MRTPLHFDLETADPDDVMTLAILATHPRVSLKSVTITPGGQDQVDLVRAVLRRLDRADVRVGAGVPKPGKSYVSSFYTDWLGPLPATGAAEPAALLIAEVARTYPETVLLTGARVTNVADCLSQHGLMFYRWVGQGGFAGDSVVPEEHRLPQFRGRETCPTFNFNADRRAAHALLDWAVTAPKDTASARATLVSKNVCHSVIWDGSFHERVLALSKRTAGLELCIDVMGHYLRRDAAGKKLHDPLAAMIALRPSIGEYREVEVYRAGNEWGARLSEASPLRIIVSYSAPAFFDELTSC